MNGSGASGNSWRAAPRSPPCRSEAAPMRETIALTLLALLIEAMVGYPDRLYRAIGHPVTWIGRLIGAIDLSLNHESSNNASRRWAGALALLIVIMVVAAADFAIERGLLLLPWGIVASGLVASALIAQRSLYHHVGRVAAALERDGLAGGRAAVAHI